MAWQKKDGRWGPEGTLIRVGPTGHPQTVRTNGWHWSDEAEEIFLNTLTQTANVTAAAAAAGFCAPTVYRQRRMRPDFAERWAAALAQAFDRLELQMLETALRSTSGEEEPTDSPLPSMTVEQAMNLLRAHRNEIRGDGQRGPGRRPRRRSLDEVRASIEQKLNAIERHRGGEGGSDDGAQPLA